MRCVYSTASGARSPPKGSTNVEDLIASSSLTPAAALYIRQALASPPSRIVNNGLGNYIARASSIKNGKSLGTESLLEYCYVLQTNHDKRIRRFCDQPPAIRLAKLPSVMTRQKSHTTPDFLEIAEGVSSLIECKWEKQLLTLSKDFPDQYTLDHEGSWHYLPGECSAKSLGMQYRIFTERDCNSILLNNLSILRPYFRKKALVVSDRAALSAFNYVTEHKVVTLGTLLDRSACRLSHILQLIATEQLYIDLARQHVLCGHSLLIALDRETFERLAAPSLMSESAAPDPTEQFVQLLEVHPRRFIGGAGWQEAEKIRRFRLIKRFLKSGSHPHQGERTLRRYLDAFKKKGIEGLKPKLRHGNARRRMPKGVYPKMKKAYKKEYAHPDQKSFQRAYECLDDLCQLGLLPTPSRRTFDAFIRKTRTLKDDTERYGERATYNQREYKHDYKELLCRHGSRIFEIAHIDHTEVDDMLIDSETGRLLMKAWLTVMLDAFSRRVLAIWLSYDPPSHVSCMMVLRECVKRFHRLPDRIIVDNGKEFNSVYFEALLAKYDRDKMNRPPHESRVGSVSERYFATLDDGVNHVLTGNTQALKNPRSMSRSVDPRRRAKHTLQELDSAIRRFSYEVYDKVTHADLQISPRRKFVNSARECGVLDLKDLPFDLSFYIASLPEVVRKTRTVDTRRGIEVDGYDYWHPFFRSKKLEGQPVEVRYEPMDIRIVFALINGHWQVCRNFQLTGDVRLTRKCVHYLGRENRVKNRIVTGRDAKRRRRIYRRFQVQLATGATASADILRARENFKLTQSLYGGIETITGCKDDLAGPKLEAFTAKDRKHFRVNDIDADAS